MTWAPSSTQELTGELDGERDRLDLLPFPPQADGDRGLSLLPTCTFPIKPAATWAASVLQSY